METLNHHWGVQWNIKIITEISLRDLSALILLPLQFKRCVLIIMCNTRSTFLHVSTQCQHLSPHPSELTFIATPFLQSAPIKNDLDFYSLVVFPDIWMMHLLSFPISLELKGRTLTATFTEAPAMLQVGVWVSGRRAEDLCGYTDTPGTWTGRWWEGLNTTQTDLLNNVTVGFLFFVFFIIIWIIHLLSVVIMMKYLGLDLVSFITQWHILHFQGLNQRVWLHTAPKNKLIKLQGHYLAGRSSASPLFYNKMAAYSSGIIPWPHISLAEGLVMKLLTASHQITRIHECLIRCGVLFWFFLQHLCNSLLLTRAVYP